jgi:pSer/pThr/pTyr-binding forkhead associated (FHA) protein
MPIDIPKGEHIILEEIDLKSSSLICIENITEEGIRMGRGNECEIKVDSPSISRNHACIQKRSGDYYIFDNKSKFGTLVREPKIYL